MVDLILRREKMNNLKFYRKRKNISQRELAQQIGVSEAFISQLENSLNTPSIKTLNKIAGVLEVDPDELNLINKEIKYESLEGKEELKFELYDWFKSKGLSVSEALDLINLTKTEIILAREAEIDKMML